MGAACCVAAKDRTIVSRSPSETLQRHTRYSPTWSFRWDNRRRVAGEETQTNWLHGGVCGNVPMEIKSRTIVDTAFVAEDGSPLTLTSSQSPPVEKPVIPSAGNAGILRLQSDPAISQNTVEVKKSIGSSMVSDPSPIKPSPSVPSMPSMATSPPSSQILPPNSTPSRWHLCSPSHRLLRQVSDSRVPGYKSPTLSISEEPSSFRAPAWGNELAGVSNGGSSDSWSIHTFPEITTTRRERWSFDSEASGSCRNKINRSSRHNSGSPSFDLQTCGICTKLLTERSVWGCASQKIMSNNEVAVVAVLICGHVYHAECLECMTPEINKYDPACPVCTYGEKRAVKMSEKALKAELDSKARKRSRRRAIDGDLSGEVLDHHKDSFNRRGPKMSSSSSMKGTIGRPFLRSHFSFSSRTTNKPVPESPSSLRKGFFWTRSSKN